MSRTPKPPPAPALPDTAELLDMLLRQNLSRLAMARQHEQETGEPSAQTTAISREIQRLLVATGRQPPETAAAAASGALASSTLCPHCGEAIDPSDFPGLYLPDGSDIDDLSVVYRFVGCQDLGSSDSPASTPQSRVASRGATGTPIRAKAQHNRAGRTQARTRKREEHA